jgi:hypothetical protein
MANEGYIIFKGRAPARRIAKEPVTLRDLIKAKCDADPRTEQIKRPMSRQDKAKIGIDMLTKDFMRDQERAGKVPSETDCRAYAQKIAEKAERKVDEGS